MGNDGVHHVTGDVKRLRSLLSQSPVDDSLQFRIVSLEKVFKKERE